MGTTWGGGKIRVSKRELRKNDARNKPFNDAYKEANRIHILKGSARRKGDK